MKHCIISFYIKEKDNFNLEGSIMVFDQNNIQEIVNLCQEVSPKLSDYSYNNLIYKNTPFIKVLSSQKEEQSFIKLVNLLCLNEGVNLLLYDGFIISISKDLIGNTKNQKQ